MVLVPMLTGGITPLLIFQIRVSLIASLKLWPLPGSPSKSVMSKNAVIVSPVLCLFLVIGVGEAAFGVVNTWTNPASAHWEEAFWSIGVLPNSNQSVAITNNGYKAVGIFPSTAANFPLHVHQQPDGLSSIERPERPLA